MWKQATGSLAVAYPLVSTVYCDNKSQARSVNKIKKINERVERYMTVHGIPGLSLAVSVNGNTFAKGFGFSNVETGSRCNTDTVMRIASISKSITSIIAAQLVHQNKLDLDKNILTYLPNYPVPKFENKEVEITTRQLLSHRSGVRHYTKKGASKDVDEDVNNTSLKEYALNQPFASVTDALKLFQDDELLSLPGKEFHYTTHGLTVVSAVLESASGKNFPDLVTDFCHRLGLRNTCLDRNSVIVNNRSSFYVRVKGALRNCQEVDNSYKWAGGGILSSAKDLIKIANAVLYSYQSTESDNLMDQEVLKLFWKGEIASKQYTKAGLGWMKIEKEPVNGIREKRQPVWYHTGAAIGASSVLFISPTDVNNNNNNNNKSKNPQGVCIAIICNLQDTSLLQLAKDIETIIRE